MSRDFYGDCIKLNIPITQNLEVRLVWCGVVWPLAQLDFTMLCLLPPVGAPRYPTPGLSPPAAQCKSC